MGGIVGENIGGTITNCIAAAQITCSASAPSINAGGIAGSNGSGSTIENCYSLAGVSADNTNSTAGSSRAGGIAGSNSGTVRACYATGAVHATSAFNMPNYSGGIAGQNIVIGTVENCVALNAGITIKAGDTGIGRIAGINFGALANNRAIAISGMNTVDALTDYKRFTHFAVRCRRPRHLRCCCFGERRLGI